MTILRLLHRWTGAVLSLLLIIVGATGGLLVLKNDWLRLTVPAARTAAVTDAAALGRAVDRLEAQDPPHVIAGMEHMHMEGMPAALTRVVLPSGDLSLFQTFYDHDGYGYADGQGRDVARWTGAGRPETAIYELHHFLLAGDAGMRVVGVEGLIAIFLALTGLVVWWPSRRAFRWRAWPGGWKRGEVLAAHRDLGVLAALPLAIFCLTGSGMIFYQTTEGLLNRIAPGGERPMQTAPADPGDVDWSRALPAVQAAYPQSRLRMIIWPQSRFAPAIVRLKQPGEWAPDGNTEVWIDAETGRLIGQSDGMKLGGGQRLFNGFYPVHTASFGGRLYDLFALLSGLALTALGVFGLWSFVVKPRRRTR